MYARHSTHKIVGVLMMDVIPTRMWNVTMILYIACVRIVITRMLDLKGALSPRG